MKIHFGEPLTVKQESRRAALICGPGLLWVTLFLLVPLLAIVAISFASRGMYGDLQWRFTLENFKRFLGFGLFGFDPLYPKIVLRSLGLALGTVTLCALTALPLTFFIAGLNKKWKQVALVLLVIPFWTNMLIRTYAWQIIFSANGWPARLAASLGFISPGEALYPGTGAVFIVLACDFLPMLALPLYASVEKIDWSIAEAASDLGANRWRVWWHALLPQVRPGLMAGGILVFVGATGQFVIPDLMGGAKTVLLGNAIQQQFGLSRDWPFGSAISCLAMIIVMVGLWLCARIAGEEGRKAML
ncbi:MAG TPA: ABC transporter permease [Verrucomicrobiae bacterium]|nr:ABC transporter permease [Verrucomicrobiae bacterium]